MAQLKTTEEFVQKATALHKNKYTYSKVVYVGSKVKVIITCPIHGDFSQQPNAHLSGANCPDCAKEVKSIKLRKPFKEFEEEAIKKFGASFIYKQQDYTTMKKAMLITCVLHGEFNTTPFAHLKSATGACESCKLLQETEKFKQQLITNSKRIHNNKYTYANVIYINTDTEVAITCPEHGDFLQVPENHLSGRGCSKCAIVHRAKKHNLTTEEFISNAKAVHGDLYDYSITKYIKGDVSLEVLCKKHGAFSVLPGNHISNQSGCPQCATSGFDKTKPAYLYYLKVTTDTDEVLYKIGITNRTVNERFNLKELSKIEIVKQKLYYIGNDAYEWEQKLLKKYKQFQYKGPNVLESGNTELFTEDIMALYYAKS